MTNITLLISLTLQLLLGVLNDPNHTNEQLQSAINTGQQTLIMVQQALSDSSTTPSIAQIPVVQSPHMEDPTPIAIYQLSHDESGYYYAGDKELDSASINGQEADITLSKHLDKDGWMVDGQKVIGYYVARFQGEAGTVQLVAKDGSVYVQVF